MFRNKSPVYSPYHLLRVFLFLATDLDCSSHDCSIGFAIVTRKDSLGLSRIIVPKTRLGWDVAIVYHPGVSTQVRVIVIVIGQVIGNVGVGITSHKPSQANLSKVRNKRKHLIARLKILYMLYMCFFNFLKPFFSLLILNRLDRLIN